MVMFANQVREKVQNDALESWFQNNCKGTLLIGTGVGKTKILIDAIRKANPSTVLILVNTEILRDVELYLEFIKWASEDLLAKCTFMCYQSAYKTTGNWGMIACDEVDSAVTPEYFKFIEGHVTEKLLCFTATLPEYKRNLLEMYAPVTFEYSTQRGQKEGILNKTKIWLVTYMLSDVNDVKVTKWNPELYRRVTRVLSENTVYNEMDKELTELLLEQVQANTEVQKKLISEKLKRFHLKRKHFLANLNSSKLIVEKLKQQILTIKSNKVMMFTESIKQAEFLSVFTYHSKNSKDNENLKLFNEGIIREISVVKAVNRGINVDGLNNVILESYSSSYVEWQQRHGRCCRLNPAYTADIFVLIPVYAQILPDGTRRRKYTCAHDYFHKATMGFDLRYAGVEAFKFK